MKDGKIMIGDLTPEEYFIQNYSSNYWLVTGDTYVFSDGLNLEVTDLTSNEVDFELDGGPTEVLEEGETDSYTVDGDDYEITALDIDEPVFETCVCDSNSDRSSCVSAAQSAHGSSDPLVRLCGSGFGQRCTETFGDATLQAKLPRILDSWGYQYETCSTSFNRRQSTFEDGAVIDQRRIQCGGTGNEDQITYKGRAGTQGETTYGPTHSCPTNYWCDQTAANNNKISNANDDFDIDPTDEISSNDICRKKAGESCTADIECVTGTLCSNNVCGGTTNTTDLEIIDVVPIQVIPGVDMIKDKSGFVRVVVKNNGAQPANGTVSVTFNGLQLNASNGLGGSNQRINANKTTNYTFDFKPSITGANLIIETSVTVS